MASPKYSIIIPVFNGQKTLEELYVRLNKFFSESKSNYEIIFVDDGSADNSWNILKQLRERATHTIKIIQLTSNFGQHNATLCGLYHAGGEIIITMDDDLQHSPEEIQKLTDIMERQQAELVYGILNNKLSFSRKISVAILKSLAKKIIHQPGEWSAFRAMKKSLAGKIYTQQQSIINIDQAAYRYTNRISFVTLNPVKKTPAKSRYTSGARFSLLVRIFILITKVPARFFSHKPAFSIKESFL